VKTSGTRSTSGSSRRPTATSSRWSRPAASAPTCTNASPSCHFLDRFAHEQKRPPIASIRPDALRALTAYPWPGNIRELRNAIFETLVYKRAGREILLSDLPPRILRSASPRETLVDGGRVRQRLRSRTLNLRDEVRALERTALAAALDESGGNAAAAARLLGAVGRGASRDPGGTVRAMKRRLGYRG
jgi:transcriptional regulator with GAF, ATPase, and Fis domain